jgi:hypothetical protein
MEEQRDAQYMEQKKQDSDMERKKNIKDWTKDELLSQIAIEQKLKNGWKPNNLEKYQNELNSRPEYMEEQRVLTQKRNAQRDAQYMEQKKQDSDMERKKNIKDWTKDELLSQIAIEQKLKNGWKPNNLEKYQNELNSRPTGSKRRGKGKSTKRKKNKSTKKRKNKKSMRRRH